jgi:hypothetical protein
VLNESAFAFIIEMAILHEPVFTILSDEIFTDRENILATLKKIAYGAKRQQFFSPVLIGHRRIGKTEVLKKLYNELFWEQNEVVPIYITFEELSRESRQFAMQYLTFFLSQYMGFKLKDVNLIKKTRKLDDIIGHIKEFAREQNNHGLLRLLDSVNSVITDNKDTWPILNCAIWAPRRVSEDNEEPIFVMLDEFQHVIEIRNENGGDPNALGKYQHAVEYRRCPHLVTGSAVTLLTKDIIGRGALFGRFRAQYIRGLEGYYVLELCQKLSKHHNVEVNPEMAAEIARRTGGNPFYIQCIFEGAVFLNENLDNIESVNRVIAYELTEGAIWSELYRQLNYYFSTINEFGITKNIFYFATRYQDEKIDPKKIASSMSHWDVDERKVRDVLLSLSRADLIEEKVAGTEFYNIKDPILREFTDTWARVDVENATWEEAATELRERYRELSGKYADFKGYATELMVKFLMMQFSGQTVDGESFFSRKINVLLPKFVWVDSKVVKLPDTEKKINSLVFLLIKLFFLKEKFGREYQIDIVAKEVPNLWLVEVKNTQQPIGLAQIKHFESACKVAEEVIRGEIITRWYISTCGFTQESEKYLSENGFLYSNREQINQLLRYFGLRELPI